MWVCDNCKSNNYDNSQYCAMCGAAKDEKKQGKPKTLLIVAIVATVCLLLIGILLFLLLQPKPESEPSDSAFVVPVETIIPQTPMVTPTPELVSTPIPTTSAIPTQAYTQTMGPFSSGRFTFVNGASILIPTGFVDTNLNGDYHNELGTDSYTYVFSNSEYGMSITLSETRTSLFFNTGRYGTTNYELLGNLREELINKRGTPSWKSLVQEYFKITGYLGNSIYYTYGVIDNDVLYIIDFYYPESNREYCDRIVEVTEASFSGADRTTLEWQFSLIRPSSADLDAINADIVYPHSVDMYLESYKRAIVKPSAGKTAVYAFKDPDKVNNTMRDGNYYTVSENTEVTIIAESAGYSCVIINDSQKAGWINSNYLVEKP